MPRSTSSTLEGLLPDCETQSTVKITLRDGSEYFLTTDGELLELGGEDYLPGLLRVGELKETLGQPTNRVSVQISNVDSEFGLNVASPARKTELADCVIHRFYRDNSDPEIYEWKHFFTGKAVSAVVDEKQVPFDVIPDTTAAGTCIATETLSPNNGFKFPETPDQSAPGSGDNDGGTVGGGHCFTGETVVNLSEHLHINFASMFEQKESFIGDEIMSFDKDGKLVETVVADIFKHTVYEYLKVTFEDESELRVTEKHPFLSETKEFVHIGEMRVGDRVLEYYGNTWHALEIVSIERVKAPEGVDVFNMTTENHHYFVAGIGVHNKESVEP
jgi:hypothetical protein